MSELPKGWVEVRLDDACHLVRGVTFPTAAKRHDYVPGTVACLRTTNVQKTTEWEDLWYIPEVHVKNEEQFVTETDILISTANSYELVGKVSWVGMPPVRATLGAFISLLRASPGVAPAFLFSQMCTEQVQQSIREMASTTTNISNVSGAKLKELKLGLAPYPEQLRIVAKLDELLSDIDAGVSELKAAQAKLAQYRQSLLKAAVDGSLTAEWRKTHTPQESGAQLLDRILDERRKRWEAKQLAKFQEQGKTPPKGWQDQYPQPVRPDTTNLPELPEGWVWATVDQLSESVRNGLSQKPSQDSIGYPILRINAVRPMAVNLSEVRYLDLAEDEAKAYILEDGDILATRYNGSVDLLGVFGVVRGTTKQTVHPDKLIRVKPVLRDGMADWIEISANVGPSRKFILSRIKTTAGQTGISGDDLKKIPLPLPPSDEQKAAADFIGESLSSLASQTEAVELLSNQSNAQRKNILKAAFSGQLVPQDPNDEPARVLLERIRSERAESQSKGVKRGRKIRSKK